MVNINWPGLLKWSTKYADGTVDTTKRLRPEDVEFLQGAIKEALSQIEDPYETLKEAIAKFQNKDEGIVLAAAKIIERLVDEYPEIARNLQKVNAIKPLLKLLDHQNVHIIESVLQILSLALSNNPTLQEAVFKEHALKTLLIKLQESDFVHIDKKLITTISALIRHHEEAEKKFIDYGGVGFLIYGMQSSDSKYQEKSALLLKHLVLQHKITYDIFVKKDILLGFACLISNQNIEETGIQFGETVAELILATLQNLRQSFSRTTTLFTIKTLIENRIQYLQIVKAEGTDDVSHEIELFQECLKLANYPGMKIPDNKDSKHHHIMEYIAKREAELNVNVKNEKEKKDNTNCNMLKMDVK